LERQGLARMSGIDANGRDVIEPTPAAYEGTMKRVKECRDFYGYLVV
jgi:hypothetical protein